MRMAELVACTGKKETECKILVEKPQGNTHY